MAAKWGAGNFFSFARNAVDRARSKVAVWNGDSESSFEGLRYSVMSAIRAGLILFSTWGSDIGGYVRDADSPSEELWARWMQFGAFSPMYEIMVGTGHTPWYPPYTSRLMGVLKNTTDWHTRLLPYLRSYAYQASQTGVPIVRALFLEYPGDASVYTTGDEYAFGAELLVAPFVDAGGSRTVYFPQGADFLEYFNKTEVRKGGTNATIELPLEYIPVYVREGAIIPSGDIYQGNAKWIQNYTASLEIEIYPSYAVPSSSFEFLRPDGNVSVITMSTDQATNTVNIAYGNLGANGRLLLYHKYGVANVTLPEEGTDMTVVLQNFASLFD